MNDMMFSNGISSLFIVFMILIINSQMILENSDLVYRSLSLKATLVIPDREISSLFIVS